MSVSFVVMHIMKSFLQKSNICFHFLHVYIALFVQIDNTYHCQQ